MDGERSIWIGYDQREMEAFAVARMSIVQRLTSPIPVYGLHLDMLRRHGLYTRPTRRLAGKSQSGVITSQLWDDISNAPMSTEFALSRFLVPVLSKGWALFTDGDVLAMDSLARLFECADARKAVMVVKHDHQPAEKRKMDGQAQTQYARKNWSSVMLFNCDHEANKRLTVEMVNTLPGRDLHRFCWLQDSEIGELSARWNYLVGSSKTVHNPGLVHFTNGVPSMPGYEKSEFAGEYFAVLNQWILGNANALRRAG